MVYPPLVSATTSLSPDLHTNGGPCATSNSFVVVHRNSLAVEVAVEHKLYTRSSPGQTGL